MKTFQVLGSALVITSTTAFLITNSASISGNQDTEERWLAGDHHVHSRYSVGWNQETNPPTPVLAGDAIYPIPMNALMARNYGLDWM
ncbi:MAG: phosphoesterase, partial [Pseudohongiella sp.]|nr:phosphoesterase [Pseudohongiella sp.]